MLMKYSVCVWEETKDTNDYTLKSVLTNNGVDWTMVVIPTDILCSGGVLLWLCAHPSLLD